MKFFDSLTHATADGTWLGGTRYDASLDRLLAEMNRAAPCRACLVAIAEYQDNHTLADFAYSHPDLFVPIAGFNPRSVAKPSLVEKEVVDIAKQGFAGIKLHPRLNFYDPLDKRCVAAIDAAGQNGLVVFLDTLFRQKEINTRHPADIVDRIATHCTGSRIVLLHGGGAHLLDMFEMVRMHSHLLLDISFTMLRYAGSSIDLDIRFLCDALDQRLIVGSDFPEYVPLKARKRITELTVGLTEEKRNNIMSGNLERLFETWEGFDRQLSPTLHLV
ncbi:MAG: amidohydrolase family protein [Nitrososphaera sp.]|nr:amidohydrolase family protein [Nitrososphaera sp.]